LYLKGGDLVEEMEPVKQHFVIHALKTYFKEAFFETKAVVYVKLNN